MGRRLGGGLIDIGHCVMIGSRNPNNAEIVEWIKKYSESKTWIISTSKKFLKTNLILHTISKIKYNLQIILHSKILLHI